MTDDPKTKNYTVRSEIRCGGDARVLSLTSTIAFDGTAQAGDVLPGPADLLCAALSACILRNVERFSHVLRFAYEAATVTVIAEREEPPPQIARMRYELVIVSDEPDPRVELPHRNIQEHGTMTNTLRMAREVRGTIRPAPKGANAS